jgi:hypothetical protein
VPAPVVPYSIGHGIAANNWGIAWGRKASPLTHWLVRASAFYASGAK